MGAINIEKLEIDLLVYHMLQVRIYQWFKRRLMDLNVSCSAHP
jgi:hypothetical protein